jgi:hypothetical protein
VKKKKVATAAVSVSSMEAFLMAGLAVQLEVPMTAASIPCLKVGEECWNSDLDSRLEAVVVAMSKSARLREILPTTSWVLNLYDKPVT